MFFFAGIAMVAKILLLFLISECSALKFRTIPYEPVDNDNLVDVNLKDTPKECLETCITTNCLRKGSDAASLVILPNMKNKKLCFCFKYSGKGNSLLKYMYTLADTHSQQENNGSVTLIPSDPNNIVYWLLNKVSWIEVGIHVSLMNNFFSR